MEEVGIDDLEGSESPAAPRTSETTAPSDAADSAGESEPALDPALVELLEDLVSKPPSAMVKAVRGLLDERQVDAALVVAKRALGRIESSNPPEPQLHRQALALSIWCRSMLAHADLRTLSLELDELVRDRDDVAEVRLARAHLRKRLGNDAGWLTDMQRVLELQPSNSEAKRAVDAAKASASEPSRGFMKRLFGR